MQEQPVKAVVFDVGNVLVKWDPGLLYRTLIADPVERNFFLSEVCSPAWNQELDRGLDWDVAIAERIATFPHYATWIAAYRDRWEEMVPGAISGTVILLENLVNAGHACYALTNFNAETFRRTRARFPFFELFRGIVVSGEEGLIKPDPRIFQCLTDRYGLEPAQTLLIDDVSANVAAARSCGWQAHQFTDAEKLAREMLRLGLMGN
ncbi:MAG: HAD family phosphatase [Holophaga sp.]|nr:HAD family phosphatase [Holophaga sp.]